MSPAPFIAASLAALALACVSTPAAVVTGGEVRNLTHAPLFDVVVFHHPTERIAAVSQILPRGRFEVSFSPRALEARASSISWIDASGAACDVDLEIPSCPPELQGQPLWFVYSIRGDSLATCAFERAPQRDLMTP